MCITKLNYSNNKLTITCDSKILETKKPNEKTIAAKFESALQADEDFNIEFENKIISAHRTPDRLFKYAKNAHKQNIKIIRSIIIKYINF